MPLEKTIQNAIKRYLAEIGAYCIVTHGSRFSKRGTPDIIACLNGRFIAIEVKTDAGQLTKLQEIELKRWQDAGALAFVARSVEDVAGKVGPTAPGRPS